MTTDRYDVIVVGAGPAGGMAALHSCRQGARTLLIERNNEPGVPVQCGEFMPAGDELQRMFPRVPDLTELLSGVSGIESNTTSTMRVFSPAGRHYSIPFNGLVMARGPLEQRLASAAVDAGAELWCGTAVTAVHDDHVETARGKVYARIIIGADGPRSVVARDLGAPALTNVAIGVQYLVESSALSDDVVDLYFGPVAEGGYGWVIPKGGGLFNIGVGVRRKGAGQRVKKEVLDPFLDHLRNGTGDALPIRATTGGPIPVGGPLKTTVLENALLVGDAAGQLMACNGGGIPTAMICGRIAGLAAAACVQSGEPILRYERLWRQAIGRELSRGIVTRKIFDVITPSKAITEIAMRIAGVPGMRKLVMCKPWYTAGLHLPGNRSRN